MYVVTWLDLNLEPRRHSKPGHPNTCQFNEFLEMRTGSEMHRVFVRKPSLYLLTPSDFGSGTCGQITRPPHCAFLLYMLC